MRADKRDAAATVEGGGVQRPVQLECELGLCSEQQAAGGLEGGIAVDECIGGLVDGGVDEAQGVVMVMRMAVCVEVEEGLRAEGGTRFSPEQHRRYEGFDSSAW